MTEVPIAKSGAALDRAKAVMILLHGRGASAGNMISLADDLGIPEIAYLAPQAPGSSWYPYSFLVPIEQNEPALSRALATIDVIVRDLIEQSLGPEQIVLFGFSQGGCLALEYAARNPRRYGAVVGLSAGLIGPPGTPRDYPGSLSGTPILLGCSDIDSHIPLLRVHESTEVLRRMEGDVTERIYRGMGHAINEDEIDWIRQRLAALAEPSIKAP